MDEKNLCECFKYEGTTPNIKLIHYQENNLKIDDILKLSETKVIIPVGVKTIGQRCFFFKDVGEIELPEGLETIEDEAFSMTIHLKRINFPETLKSIGESAFYGSGLRMIEFPKTSNLKRIESKAFASCNFEYFRVPAGVEYIAANAFADCEKLKYVYIPDSVQIVEIGAFSNCPHLNNVYLEGTIKPGFLEKRYKKIVKEERVEDGWDWHTHVGPIPTVSFEVEREFYESWCYSKHKHQNVSENEFNLIIADYYLKKTNRKKR